jgi:type VI secretion system protein ImpA
LAQARRLAKTQQIPNATSLASVDAGDNRDAPPSTRAAVRTHTVASREDVLQSFDDVCAYYARVEPSSPVPLLLQRCRRLIPLSFADALKELVPESLAALQKITGKTDA